MMFHTAQRWLKYNSIQNLNSQKTPHPSSYRAMGYVRILEKIDRVKTAPHRTLCQ